MRFPRFGPEFAFSNDKIYDLETGTKNMDQRQKFRAAWAELIKSRCEPRCKAEIGASSPKFSFPNDTPPWHFVLGTDPAVIEVQMSPLTLEEMKKIAPEVQELIFNSASDVGLRTYEFLGGGHLNMSGEILRDNPLAHKK